jgi:Ca2+-binding RTX toxin-like protein
MDAYNRGYGEAIRLPVLDENNNGSQIGTAQITTDSIIELGSGVGWLEGFYAVAYDYNGEAVISYRGTDNYNILESWNDIVNGWFIGLGATNDNQLTLAIQFYKDIAKSIGGDDVDFQTVNISTTGHSLGGGLASYIAAIYGQDSQSFDAMPFTLAIEETVKQTTLYNVEWVDSSSVVHNEQLDYDTLMAYVGDPDIDVQSYMIINPYLKQLIYETPNPLIEGGTWAPVVGGNIGGAYLDGEVLDEFARSLVDTPYTGYPTENAFYYPEYLGEYGELLVDDQGNGLLDTVDYHSMSSLVISMFADDGEVTNDAWKDAAKYFWPVLYNHNFAGQIGFNVSSNVSGTMQAGGLYADLLRTTIAYSAIEHDVDGEGNIISASVFGDTGIRALYDDANDLGGALTAAGEDSTIQAYATDISKAFVQFAGTLALNKVIKSDDNTDVLDGVLDYSSGDAVLTVDFSDALWTSATGDGKYLPSMIARASLVNSVLENTGVEDNLRDLMEIRWGDRTTNVFERVGFATGEVGEDALPVDAIAEQASLLVGSNGADDLVGSDNKDMILGGELNDKITGGTGTDIILGENGSDTLYASGGMLGLEKDIYSGGTRDGDLDTLDYTNVAFSVRLELGEQDSNITLSEQSLVYQADNRGVAVGDADIASSIERYILSNQKDWVNYTTNLSHVIETLDGGAGDNVISFADYISNITVDLIAHNVGIAGGFGVNEFINFKGFETGFGNDYFIDGEYAQIYNGNDGIDTLDFSQSSRHVAIDQNGGEALSLNLNANTYDSDTFTNIERFVGTAENDYFYVKEGEQDTYFDGAGNTHATVNGEVYTGYDVVSFEHHSASNYDTGVSVYLGSGIASDDAGTDMTFDNVEGVIGTQGIDTFEGSSDADWLFGEDGNDTINANGGNDHIIGGRGSDVLNGGDGDDTYYITYGAIGSVDTISDSAGTDVLYFTEDHSFNPGNFMRDEQNDIFKMSMYFDINGLDTIEKVTYVDGSCFAVEGLGLSFSQNYADPYVDPVLSHEIGATIYGDENDQPTEDNLVGTDKSETIYGLEMDDVLSGSDGDDTLHGGAGDDTLNGDEHKDWLFGDAGNDTLYGGNGSDSLNGGADNDTLHGGEGNDALGGDDGDDYLYGDNGNDGISGDAGNDHLYGNVGSDHLYGDEGNDFLHGQEDDDHLEGGVGDDNLSGGDGNDLLEGEDGEDTLYGGWGDDALYAGSENDLSTDATYVDVLFGEQGNDFLYGNGGGDILSGGEGHDYLEGKDGDELHGDEGEDQLHGYSNTTLDGGEGNDFLHGSGSNVTYVASAGTDVILDTGDSSVLLYDGGTLDDLTFERAANDSLVITKTGGDRVVVSNHFSGNALEYISFGGANVELSTLDNEVGFYNSVNAYDNLVYAAAMEQTFTGGDENNTYESRGVNDIVDMGAGQNTVVLNNIGSMSTVLLSTDVDAEQDVIKVPEAASFDDVNLVYENGDMNLYFGNNKITIDGATVNGQSAHIVVEVAQDFTTQTALSDMSLTLIGSSGDLNGYSIDDTIYANSSGSSLRGYTGNDTIYGMAGNDSLYGDEGDDTIYGGGGDDRVYGGAGADVLIDGNGNDIYYVDVSDYYAGVSDVLTIGAGNNTVALDWDYQNDENGDIRTLSSLIIEVDGVDSFDDLSLIKTYEEDGNGEPITISPIYTLHYSGNTLVIDEYEELFGLPTIRLSETGEEKNLQEFTLITDMSSYSTHGSAEDAPQLAQDDLYYGTSGDDYLMFSLGKDVVYGGDGNDNIQKSYAMYYDAADNFIMKSPGIEDTFEIYGEGGDDTLSGSPGSDYLDGGDGNDTIISGSFLSGDIGSNKIKGGAGDDEILLCSMDNNEVDGGKGNDTISAYYLSNFGAITEGVVVDLNEGTIMSDSLESTFENIENVDGSEFDDHIIGDSGNNVFNGYGGTDLLEGGLGDDAYEFYDGTNTIRETGGYDVIDISYANYADVAPYLSIDIVGFDMKITVDNSMSYTIEQQFVGQDVGQVEELKFMDTSLSLLNFTSWYADANQGLPITVAGTEVAEPFIGTEGLVDTVDYSSSTAGITVDLAGTGSGGTAEGDAYFSIENIVGSIYDDILTGNDDINELIAGAGNDILNGGAGDDILSGGAGDDTYVFDIGGGLNTIMETSGFDIIELGLGLVFDDLTFVQDGDDLIIQIASGFIVTDFYSGDPNLIVEQISFSDGTTFDLTSLLVSNSDPVAVDDAFSGDEDTVISGNVRGNDTDVDGDALSVTPEILTTANGGTVELLADGSFAYTPAVNFNGTDSFEYTLEDGAGGSDTGSVTLTINAVNDAPVTQEDVFTLDEDTYIVSNVLANDIDVDGDTLSFVGVDGFLFTSSAHGEVILLEDGTVVYTPEPNFAGNDSFTYSVTDGTVVTTGTINMIVSPVNDAPEAVNDAFSGEQDTVITGNVLDNDTDVDGDAITAVAGTLTTANGLTVELAADGSFTYTPQTGFTGLDSFTYTIQDIHGDTDTGQVSLDITPPSIFGTANDDILYGTIYTDTIYGYDGNDEIYGYESADTIYGGNGDDRIYDTASTHIDGGDGHDEVHFTNYGTSGVTANLLTGELYNEAGDVGSIANVESLYGSNFNDTFTLGGVASGFLYGYDGNDVLYGADRADTIFGGNGNDKIYGYESADTIYGGDGDDRIYDSASTHIDGGDGKDNVYLYSETSGVTANLLTGELYNEAGDVGSIANVESLYGSNFNDTLTLGNVSNGWLDGRYGDDTLYGGDGNDYIWGGGGIDTIFGGNGHDRIWDSASSFIDGGEGIDNVYFSGSGVTANLSTGEVYNEAGDVGSITNVERVYGTSSNDTLILGDVSNCRLDGYYGDDVLYGGVESDWIYGGVGDDVLYGGAGVDMLYGQNGADTFVFDTSALTSNDNIQDFDLSEGDKLDISEILSDYDPLTDAITDFVQITENGGNSYLSVDADGGADNFVQIAYLYGATGLTNEEALETSGNLIAA